MKISSRHIKALVLAVVYSLITLSPLEPLAFQSAAVAHTVMAECAGECSACNCSPERSASHTCCCWQKKLQDEHGQDQEQMPDCCRQMERDTTPTLTCTCPCGNENQLLFSDRESEQLPFTFNGGLPIVNESMIASLERSRQMDRHGAPPDPPPKKPVIAS
ncbi:MAG: hypothetical protein CXR31_03345 [Geobacter sp.]|nr:MAG: hypothetical protein CXR31_03345 [Geobacter sp.]